MAGFHPARSTEGLGPPRRLASMGADFGGRITPNFASSPLVVRSAEPAVGGGGPRRTYPPNYGALTPRNAQRLYTTGLDSSL